MGMLPFENILIQLIDTPALNDRDVQTRLFGLLRNADLLLVTLDLSRDPLLEMEEVIALLAQWGYLLREIGEALDTEGALVQKGAILVANKADAERSGGRFEEVQARYGSRFPLVQVSCLDGTGLDTLTEEVFNGLGKVRVYTKTPSGQPDYNQPIVMIRGSIVADAAERLHKEWGTKLKYALLWGSAKFDGQRVGRDYILADGDVIEFHG